MILLVITVMVILFGVFVYWDNNRLLVEYQTIEMTQLPQGFDGYRILQISDLHEKEFGDGQKKLIEEINALEYDAIVFTGDMMDKPEKTDFSAFFTLLEGIENKENAFFVPGNTDPDSYEITQNGNVQKTSFIQEMEEHGVLLLESVEAIQKGEDSLYFINFDLASLDPGEGFTPVYGRVARPIEKAHAYAEYQNQQLLQFSQLQESDDEVLIALSHYPIVDVQMDYLERISPIRKNMLILAGHYHGGQIRIPFLGALFVPEAWYDRNGLFPPRDRVSGLWEYNGTKQYVSTGIGSSDALSFLNFRLFNPPQINLITLTKEQDDSSEG
ncbi:metallophosphoesterase [Jeotgalibacillus proteolyticus]|nr:metallophosphoesterase [Jeotgalibacillus proteolyticus]